MSRRRLPRDRARRAVRRPAAFLHLTVTLARMDWKVRFFGSVLGYVWSLLRPLLLFGILYLVFSEVVGAATASSTTRSCCSAA